jgi:hypothetical protein
VRNVMSFAIRGNNDHRYTEAESHRIELRRRDVVVEIPVP